MLVKLGSELPAPYGYIYATSEEIERARISKYFGDWWEKYAPLRYRMLGIDFRLNRRELVLVRNTFDKLISARSGHSYFKKNHIRALHNKFDPYEFVLPKSPEHFFFWRITRKGARKASSKRRTKDTID